MADEFDDGWVRGLRLMDLEVGENPIIIATAHGSYSGGLANCNFTKISKCEIRI